MPEAESDLSTGDVRGLAGLISVWAECAVGIRSGAERGIAAMSGRERLLTDPEKDYICVKQREIRRENDLGPWVESRHVSADRADLHQLPSGQWYARTVSYQNRPDKFGTYEITPLTESELERQLELAKEDPAEFFDGERLIQEARENNVPITFWGR